MKAAGPLSNVLSDGHLTRAKAPRAKFTPECETPGSNPFPARPCLRRKPSSLLPAWYISYSCNTWYYTVYYFGCRAQGISAPTSHHSR